MRGAEPVFGPGLCRCGCGEKAPLAKQTHGGRGLVKGQPVRFIPGHQRRLPRDYEVVDRGFESPCWEWLGHRHHTNYGMCGRDGEAWAHRWYYIQAKGPIPEGLVIDHRCDNPPCVNPAHLRAVTNAVNVRRGKSKLTIEQVREIKRSPLGCRRAAREFGVAKETILGIRAGRRWAEVEA